MKTKKDFDIIKTRSSGVYAIINTSKKKVYIGETKDIQYRLSMHLSMLKKGKHHSKEMQEDYNGGDCFNAEILIDFGKDKWNKDKRLCMEDYFINCLKEREVALYNTETIKSANNFFFRASALDNRVRKLLKKIK